MNSSCSLEIAGLVPIVYSVRRRRITASASGYWRVNAFSCFHSTGKSFVAELDEADSREDDVGVSSALTDANEFSDFASRTGFPVPTQRDGSSVRAS